MYPLYYKGLRLSVTFQVKHLCVGDFASFAKIFAGFYFGKGIGYIKEILGIIIDCENGINANQSLTVLFHAPRRNVNPIS